MHPSFFLNFFLLSGLLPTGITIECNEKQYPWPVGKPEFCCPKCPPGQRMVSRPKGKCGIRCEPCGESRFRQTYDVEYDCNICDTCGDTQVEVTSCNATHNVVCKCKDGFSCRDQFCTICDPMPNKIKPTFLPTTKALDHRALFPTQHSTFSTPIITKLPSQPPSVSTLTDLVWLLVIVVLLCAAILLVLVMKFKHSALWIKFNNGYFWTKKPSDVPCAEVVSQPIQEMCGKCDQCVDLWETD